MAKPKVPAPVQLLDALLDKPKTINELCGLVQMPRETVRNGLRTLEDMSLARICGAKEVHQKGVKAMLWELHPRVKK